MSLSLRHNIVLWTLKLEMYSLESTMGGPGGGGGGGGMCPLY